MRNRLVIGFTILLSLLASQRSWTQTPTPAKGFSSPATLATDISSGEIQTVMQASPSAAINDQTLRVVSVKGEYNVGVGIVRRNKTIGQASGGAIEHSEITEVYHVITGTGTLVTGGVIDHPKEVDPSSETVKSRVGPSAMGDRIQDGVSRQLGPGDVVIIPPNTPHWFSEVTSDQIVYLVVRVDPKKVLPAGFKPK